jgi:hypothetical protein
VEKESILASNTKEIAQLRASHSKALEMIMTYQEERDSLRAEVAPFSLPFPFLSSFLLSFFTFLTV